MVVCPLLASLILAFSSGLVPDIGSFSDLQSSFKSFRDLFVMDVGCNSLSSLLFFTGGRGEAASFISVSFLGGSFGIVPPPLGLGSLVCCLVALVRLGREAEVVVPLWC